MKTIAILLAAGRGSRFGGEIKKQFVKVWDKPLLYYSLKAFNESNVDEIIIVTSKEDIAYIEDIVKYYNFTKVSNIVTGGDERYDSVYKGLLEVERGICLIISGSYSGGGLKRHCKA